MAWPKRRDIYAEECEFLASCGVSPFEWPARLGCSPAALERGLYRAGRADLAKPLAAARSAQRDSIPSDKPCPQCGGVVYGKDHTYCSRRCAALHGATGWARQRGVAA